MDVSHVFEIATTFLYETMDLARDFARFIDVSAYKAYGLFFFLFIIILLIAINVNSQCYLEHIDSDVILG